MESEPATTGDRASSLTPKPCLHLCTLTLQSVSSVNEVRNPTNEKTKTKSLLHSSVLFFPWRSMRETCYFQLGIANGAMILQPNFTPQLVPRY